MATKNKDIQFWERFARRYDSFILRMAMKTYGKVFNNIKANLNKGDIVLEAGTATGIISFEIAPHAQSITAFDLSPEMIKVAIERQNKINARNIEFIVADIYNLQLQTNYFDVVIASNIFHLLGRPEDALQELKRAAKNDGRIIISTVLHAHNFISKVISFLMEIAGIRVKNKWNAESYRAFIESCGLKVIDEIIIRDLMPSSFIVAKKIKDNL